MLQIVKVPKDFQKVGKLVSDCLVIAGLCKSNTEARNQIKGGGIRISNVKVTDPFASLVRDNENDIWFLVEHS